MTDTVCNYLFIGLCVTSLSAFALFVVFPLFCMVIFLLWSHSVLSFQCALVRKERTRNNFMVTEETKAHRSQSRVFGVILITLKEATALS